MHLQGEMTCEGFAQPAKPRWRQAALCWIHAESFKRPEPRHREPRTPDCDPGAAIQEIMGGHVLT